jgi:hypothetical protein
LVKLGNAGNYPILLKTNFGDSNEDILFRYNLQVLNFSNTQGKFTEYQVIILKFIENFIKRKYCRRSKIDCKRSRVFFP